MSGDGNIQEHHGTSAGVSGWDDNMEDDDADLLLLNDDLNLNTSSLRSDEKYKGFDNNLAESWIYPSSLPERAYQFNIVQKALFHNTLVVLPTGLGKTFIAAVVMFNIYRWYPMGKIIFMAPTRPLVAQQIEACCRIMGIPKAHSVEITGKLTKATRAQLWQSKRVFFATPQSVQSDILDTELNFPFQAVKLIVVDEAHRAKGRYAYTEVIRHIWTKNKFFRILALSATPGRRKEDVEEVIRNLFISNLEVRTEDSVDVVSYVHKRQLKVIVVDLGTKLTEIRNELLEIADPHIRNLIENRLISGRPSNISKNWLVMEQKRFREMTQNERVPYQKELNSDFSICISVYHAIELLERHGLRVFLNNFDDTQEGGPKFVVVLLPNLRRLIDRIREEIGPNPFAFSDQCMLDGQIAAIPLNIDFGHPKFEIAKENVLAHFESNKDARVIIFCEYRESVMLMHRLLLQHRPLIRPRLFVGKGGTGSIRAVTQKQQTNVMNDFRSGTSNALIATSVAEEGIDVGEVDLIVCFDISTANPTRFIQRIGRTGRKKEGKVILLATEGKEHTILKDVLSERNRMNKSISRSGQFNSVFYKQAPRMVPTEFDPKCLKLCIQVPQLDEPKPTNKPLKSKSNKVSNQAQKKDLRHFFKQKVALDDDERYVFQDSQVPHVSNKVRIQLPSTSNDTLIEEQDEIIQMSPPPKNVDINNKLVKKMAKYVRNNLYGKPLDTIKAINSNKLSKDSFQFLLDFSPDLMTDIWNQMQELWKKGIDEYNPSKGVTPEDRQVIRAYLQIVNVVGCKETVAALVESTKTSSKSPCYSSLSEKYKSVFFDMPQGGIGQDNLDLLMEKFESVSKLFPTDEYLKESYIKSMVYEDEIDEIDDQSTSVLYESSRDYSNSAILDSKYMSQWENLMQQRTNNYSQVHPSPMPTVKSVAFEQTPQNAANDSDDDVVFVGTTHQSTPIRIGPLKQSFLNFNETPIASSASKKSSKKMPLTKKSQKNILDFVKTNKIQQTKHTESSKRDTTRLHDSVKVCNKSQEPLDENPMSFFDDQFDAIIAANSGILERIENSNTTSQLKTNTNVPGIESTPSALEVGIKSTYPPIGKNSASITPQTTKSPVNVVKTTSSLGSNESTPDDIISLITTEKSEISLDSTPTGTCWKKENTKEKFSQHVDGVHPELVDIDINDLSEFSLDEIGETVTTKSATQRSPASPHRASPDIFDELCEPIQEFKAKEKSPVRLITSPPAQGSPCLLTKKSLTWGQIRQKYCKFSESEPKPAVADQRIVNQVQSEPNHTKAHHPNESIIHVPSKIRSKRRIIKSDSDSSDKDSSPIRKRKSIPESPQLIRRSLLRNARLHRKRTNEFIDDEAALSGSATEDEFEHTIGRYIHDSVVVDDDVAENESSIPMTGVYLQSVRSPCNNIRGTFKIPARRQYNDASKIFSQKVTVDDGSYMKDSFVVLSDEECDVEKSMCPLERAEEILKTKRRAKRRAKLEGAQDEFVPPAKKKRVLRIHNSSEDDDDFV